MENLIGKLSCLVGQDRLPALIASLRQDPLVWDALQDPLFSDKCIALFSDDIDGWSPGNIALVSIDLPPRPKDLERRGNEVFSAPIPDTAAEVLRDVSDPKSSSTPSPDLENAALLSLALLEKRHTLGSWHALFQELSPAHSSLWRSAFACLVPIVPDSLDMLAELVDSAHQPSGIHTAVHALLAQPLAAEEQAAAIYDLMLRLPEQKKLDILQHLSRQRPHLSREIASQISNDLSLANWDSDDAYSEFLHSLYSAELNRIAGKYPQSQAMLNEAWGAFQSLQTQFASHLALAAASHDRETAGEILKTLSPHQGISAHSLREYLTARMVLEPASDLVNIKEDLTARLGDHPLDLFYKALSAAHHGQAEETDMLLHGSVKAAVELEPEQAEPLAGFQMLLEHLIDREMYPQAEQLALAMLSAYPNQVPVLLDLARSQYHDHRPKDALESIACAFALHPQDIQISREYIAMLSAARQWKQALQRSTQLLASQPEPDTDDLFSHVAIAIAAADADEAESAAEKLVDSEPASGLAHTLLGESLLLNDSPDKAQASFEAAKELSPQVVRPWLAQISLLQHSGNLSQAHDLVEQALKTDPDDFQLQVRFAQILRGLDRDHEAAKVMLHAARTFSPKGISLHKDLEEDCLVLAEALQSSGHFSVAVSLLESAAKRFPAHPGLVHAYARVHIQSGDFEGASKTLESLAALDPDDPEIFLDIARIAIETGAGHQTAKTAVSAVLAIHPDHPLGVVMDAELEHHQGRTVDLVRMYKQAIDDPDTRSSYWQKYLTLKFAQSALQAGEPEAAIDQLRAAIKLVAADQTLLKISSEAYLLAGLPEDALAFAKKAYQLAPADPDSLAWFADQASKMGLPDQAAQVLEEASETYQDDPRLIFRIGQIYAQSGDVPSAVEKFEKLLQLKDAPVSILHEVGRQILALHEPRSAVPFLQKAVSVLSAPGEDLLSDLARAQELGGDFNGALLTVSELLRRAPKDTPLIQKRADLEIALGRIDQAIRSIDETLAIDPKDRSLLVRSAQLRRRTGDMQTAIDHAHQAMLLEPKDVSARTLYADLLRACLDPAGAWAVAKEIEWSIDDLESIGANRADASLVAAFALQAELAIENNEMEFAHKLIESIEGSSSPRLLALQSRHAVFHADYLLSAEKLSAAKQIFVAESDGMHAHTRHGIASAAAAANDWPFALQIAAQLSGDSNEPLYSFSYAKFLILQAEYQHSCAAVHIVARSPGIGSLTGENYRLTRDALAKAGRSIPALEPQLAPWAARADLAFDRAVPAPVSDEDQEMVAARARALARKGDAPAALELLGNQREYPLILSAIADISSRNDPDRAYQYALKAADLDAAPVNHARLAFAADAVGHAEEALANIRLALQAYPQEPRWNLLAGKLSLHMDHHRAAADFIQKALDIEPQSAEAHLLFGKTLNALGEYARAISHFEQAEEQEPQNFEVALGLALSHMKLGAVSPSAKYARKAGGLDPSSIQPKLIEAQIAMSEGKAEKALSLVAGALSLQPENPDALAIHFEVLQALGREGEALLSIQKAIELSSEPVPLLLQKAEVILRSEGLEKGLAELKLAAAKFPRNPRVLARLSKVHFEAGDLEQAIRLSQRALKSPEIAADPAEAAGLHLLLGRQLAGSGQLDLSIHHLVQATELDPGSVEAYLEAGRVQQDRRRPGEALDFYKKAISLAPTDHRAYLDAGLLFKDIKDFVQAEHMLRCASDLQPKNALIQRHLAATITLNLVHPTRSFSEAKAEA